MNKISPEQICFGLNEELDRQSFSCFLQLAGRPKVADLLASRMTSEEIDQTITHLTELLKKHFTSNEYHSIFLQTKARTKPANTRKD